MMKPADEMFSDVENFKRLLHSQLPASGKDAANTWGQHDWDSELRKKPRGDTVMEEVVIRLRDVNVGFVFDADTGRLKYAYRW